MRKLRTIMSLLLAALLIVSAFPDCNTKAESFVKTGIIGAMDEEVDSLKKAVSDAKTTIIGSMEFCEGMLDGQSVVIVKCGVGKVNAAICTQVLVGHFRATPVINTGIAGSLNNDLNIGDIVISNDVVHHDVEATVWGYAPGQIPGMEVAHFPGDEDLAVLAERICAEVNPDIRAMRGRVASGDQFISDNAAKQRIIETFGADCAEMEGAAIAQVCYLNRVPFVILRTISDKADGSAVADNTHFTEEVIARNDKLVRAMMREL